MADKKYPRFRAVVQIHYLVEGAEEEGSTVISHMLHPIPSDPQAAVVMTQRVLDALLEAGLLDLTTPVPDVFLPPEHRTPGRG